MILNTVYVIVNTPRSANQAQTDFSLSYHDWPEGALAAPFVTYCTELWLALASCTVQSDRFLNNGQFLAEFQDSESFSLFLLL